MMFEMKNHYRRTMEENIKLKEDMKTIKDGFDVCRLIKSITDEYDFEEERK